MLFQLTERINAPAAEVFALVTDFAYTMPKVDRDMVAVEKLTAGPIRQGTRWREMFRGPGRKLVLMHSEVSAFDPPRCAEAHFTATGVRGRITFTCVQADGSPNETDLTISLKVTVSGIGLVLYPLVRWDAINREKRRLKSFKQLVESGIISAAKLEAATAEDMTGP